MEARDDPIHRIKALEEALEIERQSQALIAEERDYLHRLVKRLRHDALASVAVLDIDDDFGGVVRTSLGRPTATLDACDEADAIVEAVTEVFRSTAAKRQTTT